MAPRTRWTVEREELSWAAGFFDGEGCFSYTDKAAYASVSIVQVERRPLERFQDAVGGLGTIYGPYFKLYPGRMSKQPWHQYRAYRREHVQAIAALLWFKLGETKRNQAKTVLLKLRSCRRGHRLGAKQKSCPRCTAEYWARYRATHAARSRPSRSVDANQRTLPS
jgi:hypothetical protein